MSGHNVEPATGQVWQDRTEGNIVAFVHTVTMGTNVYFTKLDTVTLEWTSSERLSIENFVKIYQYVISEGI